MPDRTAQSKFGETELYRCKGIRRLSKRLYLIVLVSCMVLFFFLVRSIQGNRQTVLLWLMCAIILAVVAIMRSSQSYLYTITQEGVQALDAKTQKIIWSIDARDILRIRLLPGKISISIPKKTYLVYTGNESDIFASHLRTIRSMNSRS